MTLPLSAHAASYTFRTDSTPRYYGSTSYGEIYGSRYNYGGSNLVDYEIPQLIYGSPSTTQTGIMERLLLPGLLQNVALGDGGIYGISATDDAGIPSVFPGLQDFVASVLQQTAFTSVNGMARSDGSIGTVNISSLGISVKVWEGETSKSMAKGLGHYSSTSGWDGNVGVCGHNRGAKYVIGSIKDLKIGDIISYTTVFGTRTYQVSYVGTIANTDWSYLQGTPDNRITLTTGLADHPEVRVCVQATEVIS